jgi:hypothetical protein
MLLLTMHLLYDHHMNSYRPLAMFVLASIARIKHNCGTNMVHKTFELGKLPDLSDLSDLIFLPPAVRTAGPSIGHHWRGSASARAL